MSDPVVGTLEEGLLLKQIWTNKSLSRNKHVRNATLCEHELPGSWNEREKQMQCMVWAGVDGVGVRQENWESEALLSWCQAGLNWKLMGEPTEEVE